MADLESHGLIDPPEWNRLCDDETCLNNNQEGKCEVEICQYVPM